MKIRYLFTVLTISVGLSGCQLGPLGDTQADRLTTQANKILKTEPGNNVQTACSKAVWQTFPLSSALDKADMENKCFDRENEVLKQEAQQQLNIQYQEQQAQRRAQQAAQQKELSRQIAEIKAGRASIRTAQEAAAIYHATDGSSLMAQPLLRPDNHYYVIDGEIDPAGGLQSNGFTIKASFSGAQLLGISIGPAYAYIILKSEDDIPKGIRVGSSVKIVGAYTENRKYTTMDGATHIMPVFSAKFIQAQ